MFSWGHPGRIPPRLLPDSPQAYSSNCRLSAVAYPADTIAAASIAAATGTAGTATAGAAAATVAAAAAAAAPQLLLLLPLFLLLFLQWSQRRQQ